MTSPLLRVRDLAVEFHTSAGTVSAVNGVSFDLEAGEALAILGESGSGKSVTAQALMGLIRGPAGHVSAGEVRYHGVDLRTRSSTYHRRLRGREMSMIFQDPLSSLNPVHRVGFQIGEMFRHHRGASRKEARAAAIEMMELVGIPGARERVDDYPHQFSGGMRQRVMIAMALALEPELLIADEPTTALDVTVQAQIMQLLKRLQEERGMALLLISHDLGVVADVADRVLLMYAGSIVEAGDIQEVYEVAAHPYTRGLMGSVPDMDHPTARLEPVVGAPPNMLGVPSGCAFRPRCGLATSECVEVTPDLLPAPGRPVSHRSACHHAETLLAGGTTHD